MITYSHQLYAVFEPFLGIFERRGTPREPSDTAGQTQAGPRIIIFGLGRFGTAIGLRLHKRGIRIQGIDFNPLAVRRWRELGLDAIYADAGDPEFIGELPLANTELLVSTIPTHPTGLSHEDIRVTLIQLMRQAGFRGRIAMTSHNLRDAEDLFGAGADIVLEPFQDAADRAVDLLCGAREEKRTEIPAIETEQRELS